MADGLRKCEGSEPYVNYFLYAYGFGGGWQGPYSSQLGSALWLTLLSPH